MTGSTSWRAAPTWWMASSVCGPRRASPTTPRATMTKKSFNRFRFEADGQTRHASSSWASFVESLHIPIRGATTGSPVTGVESNALGVRAVTIAPSPSGAISQGRAVRRTVEEFISAFLVADPAPTRSPAPPARSPATAGGRGTPVPQLTLTTATLDVSRRPLGKALRLWPNWQRTAPSLATPTAAAIDDLAELLSPLMGRPVRGRTAVLSALAKVDGILSFEQRRKASLRTVARDLSDEVLSTADVGALFRDHLCPGGTPGGTPAGSPPRRQAARQTGTARGDDAPGEDLLGRLGSGDEGDATDSGGSDDEEPAVAPRARGRAAPVPRATGQIVDDASMVAGPQRPRRDTQLGDTTGEQHLRARLMTAISA